MRSGPTVWSFACVGLVGGAASATIVDAAFVIVLAPTTALLCALLGAIVGRLRHGWAITIPLVPLAGAVNGALAASIALHDVTAMGAQMGLVCSLPFLIVLPPIAYVASLGEARPGSLARGLERGRLAAATTLAGTLLATFAVVPARSAYGSADGRQHALALVLALAVFGSALVTTLAIIARRLRANEALRTVPLLRATERGAVAQRDADFLDLGLGTTQHVYLDPTTLLRAMPAARVMYEGDAEVVAKVARRTMVLSLASLATAAALSVACIARLG